MTTEAALGADPAFCAEGAFPKGYGETRVTLLVRDPNWLFAFWEVDPRALAAARVALGDEARFTLRVADFGPAAFDPLRPRSEATPHRFDVEVPDAIGDWHIGVWGAGHAYQVEIGLATGRAFWGFAASAMVATPPGRVSGLDDAAWLHVEPLYRAAWRIAERNGSAEWFLEMERRAMARRTTSRGAL
ncbi:MAG TPA: DUF4912 domain-containing protein [Limnochordia bacterium]|nr:DUF4912 domain-containing protein [Limnochordia bacterium]